MLQAIKKLHPDTNIVNGYAFDDFSKGFHHLTQITSVMLYIRYLRFGYQVLIDNYFSITKVETFSCFIFITPII